MSTPGSVGGFSRCPKCGSTEITFSQRAGMLMCMFCRATWQEASAEQSLGFDTDISQLSGAHVSQGARNIDRSSDAVVTLKCQGCGAEVVINSATNVQARCHWCRSFLSLDARIPNGAVPDAVLPFSVTRDQAVEKIREFAKKRMGFAQAQFKREFTPENVVGVYMPYFVADVHAEVAVRGEGEVQTRKYTVKNGDREETRYDANVYDVIRQFTLTMDDLVLESSARRAQSTPVRDGGGGSAMDVALSTVRDPTAALSRAAQMVGSRVSAPAPQGSTRERDTSNIINAVLPFDTKNAVQYNANYLGTYTSEKRDLDVTQVSEALTRMVFGTGTAQIRPTLTGYDRGVRWYQGAIGIHGVRFMSMYAPIWLYSHYERKSNGNELLHYIAVNGRTAAVMGSVPINHAKLALATAGVFVVSLVPTVGLLLWV